MADAGRVRHDGEPAFVLHSYPYRETSLIIEAFTRNYGRVALVARGARRPRSVLRGVLLAFQPLLLSWGGKAELRTLHKAEWQGGLPQLTGRGLLCGFYLNELMLKLLARDDAHEALYETYHATLSILSNGGDHAMTLRSFEQQFLKEAGYALTLDHDVMSGEAIRADRNYHYLLERGPVLAARDGSGGGDDGKRLELAGQTLLDMARDEYSSPVTQQQSKALMRMLINHCLGNQTLNTRQLLKDMQQL
ncbi:MAG: DNA repair protein RecO [Betaproteobacteria bacterium]|nr:DNA repair protein RecO [Betaproteobacteria bacterium]